ncbi:MAG: multifunctional CCA addition/repair protein [Wenzhouxiangellaceae bacterium]
MVNKPASGLSWSRDPLLKGLEVYRVGGAVRDERLGITPDEHDFVVVGASPEDMVQRGFRPIGRDFPVFLHPETHSEFALARTERKSGPGYRGFCFHTGPEVSLSADLKRRDLTINAIAEDRDGKLIDPFGGRADLDARVLRHVSDAFAEDPVRLLRLARFATRFSDFQIAPATLALCRGMVNEGEIDHLVAERVWQEMARALMHQVPSRFFDVLRQTGALQRLIPELDALWGVGQVPQFHPEIDAGVHVMLVIDQAAALDAPLTVRFACLLHDLGKALTPVEQLPKHVGHEQRGIEPVESVCRRFKVPGDCRDLAVLVCRHHLVCHRALELKASTILKLFDRLDAFRRPQRFEQFVLACEADKRGRKGCLNMDYPAGRFLRQAFRAAAEVAVKSILERGMTGPRVGEALRAERIRAVAALPRIESFGAGLRK